VSLKKRANRSETWLSCDQTKKTSIPAIRRLLVFFVWSQLRQVSDRFALFFSDTADALHLFFDLIFSNLDTDATALRLFYILE